VLPFRMGPRLSKRARLFLRVTMVSFRLLWITVAARVRLRLTACHERFSFWLCVVRDAAAIAIRTPKPPARAISRKHGGIEPRRLQAGHVCVRDRRLEVYSIRDRANAFVAEARALHLRRRLFTPSIDLEPNQGWRLSGDRSPTSHLWPNGSMKLPCR